MITSKQISNLSEKYIDTRNIAGNSVEFYENPDASDLADFLKYSIKDRKLTARYIADANKKKVYIFSAYHAIHRDGLRFLGYPTEPYDASYILTGEASIKSGKLVPTWPYMTSLSYAIDYYSQGWGTSKIYSTYLDGFFTHKWDWLNSYIVGISSDIAKVKSSYDKKKKELLKK